MAHVHKIVDFIVKTLVQGVNQELKERPGGDDFDINIHFGFVLYFLIFFLKMYPCTNTVLFFVFQNVSCASRGKMAAHCRHLLVWFYFVTQIHHWLEALPRGGKWRFPHSGRRKTAKDNTHTRTTGASGANGDAIIAGKNFSYRNNDLTRVNEEMKRCFQSLKIDVGVCLVVMVSAGELSKVFSGNDGRQS